MGAPLGGSLAVGLCIDGPEAAPGAFMCIATHSLDGAPWLKVFFGLVGVFLKAAREQMIVLCGSRWPD